MDTLANMLSTIKNASMVNKESVEINHTKINEQVAEILKQEGFLKEVKTFKEKGSSHKSLHIDLAYDEKSRRVLQQARRISKPGRRVYKGYEDLPRVKKGFQVVVVSTPRGIMSSTEARKQKLGGEVICEVR